MKTVPVFSKGSLEKAKTHYLIVDDEDFNLISSLQVLHLNRKGVVRTRNTSLTIRLLGHPPDGLVIDHVNRDKLDFRRENLRVVTHISNSRNRSLNKNNTTGFKGVVNKAGSSTYSALLSVAGHNYYSFSHKTAEDAARAYDDLVKLYCPEATTNEALGLLKPLRLA